MTGWRTFDLAVRLREPVVDVEAALVVLLAIEAVARSVDGETVTWERAGERPRLPPGSLEARVMLLLANRPPPVRAPFARARPTAASTDALWPRRANKAEPHRRKP